MTTDWATFGDPTHFELGVRWRNDSEPRARRPKGYGWSIGDLRITVAGRQVTRNRRGAAAQSYVSWYVFPVCAWIAENWIELLHEEDFAWPKTTSLPAAAACSDALQQWIDADQPQGRTFYKNARAWYRRHALRAGAEGGLFPDLYLRRLLDTIELSWTGSRPPFAGDDFAFMDEPGAAYLPVTAVARPLWDLLEWCVSSAPVSLEADVKAVAGLKTVVDKLRELPVERLDEAYAGSTVLSFARAVLDRSDAREAMTDTLVQGAPAIAQFSPAVAMFGGVSPSLGEADVRALSELLVGAWGGSERTSLGALVEDAGFPAARAPYLDGQRLALNLIEDLKLADEESWIDVRAVVDHLGIRVLSEALETDGIRGVALAGDGLAPTILVNLASPYNSAEEGRRFSIAHELCHIVYDRSHARRVAVSSGPWAPASVEKRANAFAAMLLMPPKLVAEALPHGRVDREALAQAAAALRVSEHALSEHAYNIGLIDESLRERLRAARH